MGEATGQGANAPSRPVLGLPVKGIRGVVTPWNLQRASKSGAPKANAGEDLHLGVPVEKNGIGAFPPLFPFSANVTYQKNAYVGDR